MLNDWCLQKKKKKSKIVAKIYAFYVTEKENVRKGKNIFILKCHNYLSQNKQKYLKKHEENQQCFSFVYIG